MKILSHNYREPFDSAKPLWVYFAGENPGGQEADQAEQPPNSEAPKEQELIDRIAKLAPDKQAEMLVERTEDEEKKLQKKVKQVVEQEIKDGPPIPESGTAEEAAEGVETKEDIKAKTEFIENKDSFKTLTKRLSKALFGNEESLDPDNENVASFVKKALATLDATKLRNAKETGNLNLDKKEKEAILKTARDELNGLVGENEVAKKEELTLLESFGSEIDLDLGAESKLTLLIAAKFNIEENTAEGVININGEPVKTKKDFVKAVGGEGGIPRIEKYVNPSGDTDEDFLDELEKAAENDLNAREALVKIIKNLDKTEMKNVEGFNLGNLITFIMSIMDAFKQQPPDFGTMNDIMKDFTEGKNPAEQMKKSKTAYESFMEGDGKKQNLDTLLDAYLNPRSESANKLFEGQPEDQQEALGRYRGELPKAIQSHLIKELGINITSIDKAPGGLPRINGVTTKKNEKITILVAKDADGRPTVQINKLVKVDDIDPNDPAKKIKVEKPTELHKSLKDNFTPFTSLEDLKNLIATGENIKAEPSDTVATQQQGEVNSTTIKPLEQLAAEKLDTALKVLNSGQLRKIIRKGLQQKIEGMPTKKDTDRFIMTELRKGNKEWDQKTMQPELDKWRMQKIKDSKITPEQINSFA